MGLALIFVSGQLDTTAPVLSLPTGVQTGSTTGSGTVTTDEAGTLYFWATENATETAAAIKASGDSQAAAIGVNNVVFTGLTAETAYYAHYVEDDASSNESNVVTSTPAFTTTSGTRGGYVPPTYIKTKRRKKDESILEQVYELVAKLDEIPAPQKLKERVKRVEVKAEKVVKLTDFTQHDKQLKTLSAQIGRVETAINTHIRAFKQDEEDAIQALLSIL